MSSNGAMPSKKMANGRWGDHVNCSVCSELKLVLRHSVKRIQAEGRSYVCGNCARRAAARSRRRPTHDPIEPWVPPEQKRRIRSRTWYAIRTGKIKVAGCCQFCGAGEETCQVHHLTYETHTKFLFLCRACHRAADAELAVKKRGWTLDLRDEHGRIRNRVQEEAPDGRVEGSV